MRLSACFCLTGMAAEQFWYINGFLPHNMRLARWYCLLRAGRRYVYMAVQLAQCKAVAIKHLSKRQCTLEC
jgi:hypothetical protein